VKATNNGNGNSGSQISQPAKLDITPKSVRRWDWSALTEPEHFVQFYETDEYFLDSLEPFVITGLLAGDGVILAATGSHLKSLESRLLEGGF